MRAVEHDLLLGIELSRAARADLAQRDQLAARDVALLELLGLAHVDELDLAVQLRQFLGRDQPVAFTHDDDSPVRSLGVWRPGPRPGPTRRAFPGESPCAWR